MALVGLVRVSTSEQETQRQHDDLDSICVKVFEEKVSGKLRVADRPELRAALDYMRAGDMLAVQEADRLGRNLLEGLIVLNDLFQQALRVGKRAHAETGIDRAGQSVVTAALEVAATTFDGDLTGRTGLVVWDDGRCETFGRAG